MHPSTEIVTKQSIEGIVSSYDASCQKIREADELIREAVDLAENVASYGGYLTSSRGGTIDFDPDYVIRGLTKSAWNGIMKRLGVTEFASCKRRKEMQEQIDGGKTPEFTVANIQATIATLTTTFDEMFTEAVGEVFDWLKPGHWDQYKTNEKNKYEIQGKAIVPGLYTGCCGGLSHYRRDHVKALDTVFSMLDGEGVPRYPEDLVTKLEEAMRDKQTRTYEDRYFHFKWFKNGNAHVTFKRADLLSQLNEIAGNGIALKQEQERKSA